MGFLRHVSLGGRFTFLNKVLEAAELIHCCITFRTKTPRSVCLLIQVLLQLIPLSPKPFAGLLVFVAFSSQTCCTLTTAALTILRGHCSVEDRIVWLARYKQACNSFDLHGFRVYFLSHHRFDLLLLWYSGKEGPYQDRPPLCPFRLSPLLTCSGSTIAFLKILKIQGPNPKIGKM